MEYTNIIQPLTVIFISFSLGIFFGSIWMFYAMYKSSKQMEQELDSKTRLLTAYENNLNNKEDE